MLNGYDILMTDNIISYYNDDIIYTVLVYLNGYIFVPCTDYSIWSDRSWNKNKIRFFNTVDALSRQPHINGDYRNTSAMLVTEIQEHLNQTILYKTYITKNLIPYFHTIIFSPRGNFPIIKNPQS